MLDLFDCDQECQWLNSLSIGPGGGLPVNLMRISIGSDDILFSSIRLNMMFWSDLVWLNFLVTIVFMQMLDFLKDEFGVSQIKRLSTFMKAVRRRDE